MSRDAVLCQARHNNTNVISFKKEEKQYQSSPVGLFFFFWCTTKLYTRYCLDASFVAVADNRFFIVAATASAAPAGIRPFPLIRT